MASSMVLMQESEGKSPKVTAIRERIMKLITEKHVTTVTKVSPFYCITFNTLIKSQK
jgi:hypothetical protein